MVIVPLNPAGLIWTQATCSEGLLKQAATIPSVSAQSNSPLTSCRPFSVSWKTPVFWDVSRWDFRALFPIRTLVQTVVDRGS